MKHVVDDLAWILPALVLAGILVYSFWWRERPRAERRITGDYAAAAALAAAQGSPLLLAVDSAPY